LSPANPSNSSELKIRPAHTRDAARIAELLLPLAEEEGTLPLLADPLPVFMHAIAQEIGEQMFGDTDNCYALACWKEDGDETIVGVLRFGIHDALVPYRGRVCVVDRLVVDPDYRGNGVAPALIAAVKTLAAKEQVDLFQLSVTHGCKRPVGYYEALGFRPVETVMVCKASELRR
jgi:GNAT superfamily N-acetyltransferase